MKLSIKKIEIILKKFLNIVKEMSNGQYRNVKKTIYETKNKVKNKKRKRFILLLIILLMVCFNFLQINYVYALKISSPYAVAIEMDSGRILYKKNATKRSNIASTTKIMTAIVAIESGKMNDMVIISKRAQAVGGSELNLKVGYKVSMNNLLRALLIKSANDSAIAIAEQVGGSVEQFAVLMNNKAKEIGANDTNFVTPHGLDVPNHYSTAYDMALIAQYALKNPIINEIVRTNETIVNINGKEVGIRNTNQLLRTYPYADGVKTGFTGLAGRCLVGSATQNGMRIITVLLGCNNNNQRASETKAIMEDTFEKYSKANVLENVVKNFEIEILKGNIEKIHIQIPKGYYMPVTKEEKQNISVKYVIPKVISAPIEKGKIIGKIQVVANGAEIKKFDLICNTDIKKKNTFDFFIKIFRGTFKNIIRF